MDQVLHPDLIMLDLSMPVMNGIEAACALKRLMPKTPIIVFSEYSDVFSDDEARIAGLAARVSKKREPLGVTRESNSIPALFGTYGKGLNAQEVVCFVVAVSIRTRSSAPGTTSEAD